MRFVTTLVPLFAAAGVVVATASAPAWAHEEITPASFPMGRPVFLTLSAANERSAAVTRVVVRAPAGVGLGAATLQPPGWTAQRSGQSVTWSGGSVGPASFEQWGFELDPVAQPGPLRFAVTLGYADGDAHDSQVEASAGPASSGAPAAPLAPTSTVASPTTVPSGGAASGATSGEDRADAALVVAVVAGLLSLAALGTAVAARRRSSPPVGDAAPGEQEGQDW